MQLYKKTNKKKTKQSQAKNNLAQCTEKYIWNCVWVKLLPFLIKMIIKKQIQYYEKK